MFKPKFWQKKNSLLAILFLPLSIIFQFLFLLKKTLVKKKNFSIPVICVGNIYLGGTGKTPLCIKLAEILKRSNKKTVIIKKFYKSHEDEFNLIESNKIRLFKDVSRSVAIKKAEVEKFDAVILDDGLQDSSIFKDLKIICFNAEQLAGNEMTLPSGPLREPLSSVKKSDIVIINGNANKEFQKKIKSISSTIGIYYSNYVPTNSSKFANHNLLAFAGIGNPNNFFNLLEKNNLKIRKKIPFPDHYNYSFKELNNLVEYSKINKLKIVTTEKDYYRIKNFKIPEIQYLGVKLKIEDEAKLEVELKKCLF